MKTYIVTVIGTCEIEASSPEEAKQQAAESLKELSQNTIFDLSLSDNEAVVA